MVARACDLRTQGKWFVSVRVSLALACFLLQANVALHQFLIRDHSSLV